PARKAVASASAWHLKLYADDVAIGAVCKLVRIRTRRKVGHEGTVRDSATCVRIIRQPVDSVFVDEDISPALCHVAIDIGVRMLAAILGSGSGTRKVPL